MSESARKSRLLVADDSSQILVLVRRILEKAGFDVVVAADADEALRLAAEQAPIDLLIADVTMPGIPGPELAARLRERAPSLPVVFMSGYTADLALKDGLSDNAFFLHKPFTREDLVSVIKKALLSQGTG